MSEVNKPLDVFWFIPVSGDGAYLGSDKGARPADFSYLKQIAQAADRLGFGGRRLTGLLQEPTASASAAR